MILFYVIKVSCVYILSVYRMYQIEMKPRGVEI